MGMPIILSHKMVIYHLTNHIIETQAQETEGDFSLFKKCL